MVELQEASLMLTQSTQHSLIILDELGRGTSTFDGYAIAYAVIEVTTYLDSNHSTCPIHLNLSFDPLGAQEASRARALLDPLPYAH